MQRQRGRNLYFEDPVILASVIGFQLQLHGVRSVHVESGASSDYRGILSRGFVLHRKYKYLSISANLRDKLWPRVREEGFSTVFHKHWVARKSKDAENTSLGAVRDSGLYTDICVSAEGTSCVGKVRPHLQVAVG